MKRIGLILLMLFTVSFGSFASTKKSNTNLIYSKVTKRKSHHFGCIMGLVYDQYGNNIGYYTWCDSWPNPRVYLK